MLYFCVNNFSNISINFLIYSKSWVFEFTVEDQTTSREVEEEIDHTCEKDVLTMEEEETSISAPILLSQERMQEVCRRLHTLQDRIKRLQVRTEGVERQMKLRIWRKHVSREYDGDS